MRYFVLYKDGTVYGHKSYATADEALAWANSESGRIHGVMPVVKMLPADYVRPDVLALRRKIKPREFLDDGDI